MAVQAFKYFTIQSGGTPQPLIGSYLTAAVTQTQVTAAGMARDGLVTLPITVAVADSSPFVGAQYAQIVDPTTYVTEGFLRVIAAPTSTSVLLQGILKPHPGGAYGTGAWIALANYSQQIYVQAKDGNTGALYLGTSPKMVISTGVLVIAKLQTVTAGVQPTEFYTSRQGLADTEGLGQYWIDGTTGDAYLPSAGLV